MDNEEKMKQFLSGKPVYVDWDHHPEEIKNEIRRTNQIPELKQCFMNCQRFMLCTQLPSEDLKYQEGYAYMEDFGGLPFEHAWLEFKGQIVDLTLEDTENIRYGESFCASKEEVVDAVLKEGVYSPIREEELRKCHPFRDQINKVQEMLNEKTD